MRKLHCLLIGLLLMLSSIYGQGIKFQEGLSWSQILAMAKIENKSIFMDCYASWCGPCKAMDKEVYTNNKLGNWFNEKFISIKVQMDTTKLDNENIKLWYNSARKFQENYLIDGFPTFMFFNYDGSPIHRGIGYKNSEELLTLAMQALDTSEQIYTQLTEYNNGRRDYKNLKVLSYGIKLIGTSKLADLVIQDYINYLNSLSDEELLNKENLIFICNNLKLIKSSDHFFKLCYKDSHALDSMKINMAQDVVMRIIDREEIRPYISDCDATDKVPNWKYLTDIISKKYNKNYSEYLILKAQVSYYNRKEDWGKFVYYLNKKTSLYPPQFQDGFFGDAAELNGAAWDLFLKCKDKQLLKEALEFSELALEKLRNVDLRKNFMDTNANIRYKLGDINTALKIERDVIEIAKADAGHELESDDVFIVTYKKMVEGKPTWD